MCLPVNWSFSEENIKIPIRRQKKDLTQVASCCETEESWNGRVRRISIVHKHTVTAGESNNPKDHRREDWDQPNEDRKWNRKIPRRFPIKYNYFPYSSNGQKVLIFYSLFSYNVLYYCITDVIAGESKQY